MSAFNTTTKGKSAVLDTVNHEGAPAASLSAKLELYSAVTTFLFQDKFYEDKGGRIERIKQLITKVEPKFVAKLAVYARDVMHLRSVPLALVVELARIHNGDDLVRRATRAVVQRADEIAEVLAYYQLANPKTGIKKLNKLSSQLQKGLGDAFNKFNEYQFAKYNRDGEVKLRDALFLVHPKPKNAEQQAIFDKIAKQTLQTPDTWEVGISAQGSDAGKKKAEWERLVAEKKLPYMATLRNLRNLLEAGVSDDTISQVCAFLSDPKQVANSKQFPFRFLSAYRELPSGTGVSKKQVQSVQNALEAALTASAENIIGFQKDERVAIACDFSGSMHHPISTNSKIQAYEIGAVLGMLLENRCDKVMIGAFGDRFKWINVPGNGLLNRIQNILVVGDTVGWSTNGYLVPMDLTKHKTFVDKLYIFTDMQLWNSHGSAQSLKNQWDVYKSQVNPKAKLYLIDVSGYGNTPINVMEPNVYYVSGWSDRVFEVMETMQNGNAALQAIESVQL